MKKICVTGANGFIGKAICTELIKLGILVSGTVRSSDSLSKISNLEYVSVGDISDSTNWSEALLGCDCVIHCAGIAHEAKEFDLYQRVNIDATKELANQAVVAGVKRLIFLSSIKVNGESTDNFFHTKNFIKKNNKVFNHNDVPSPEDNYALSKLKAENALLEISAKTGLEVVILRLPLVYGFGVKGNMSKLLNIVSLGVPLPFGGIKNKRSLIGIDNLIDLICLCIDNTKANRKIFLVSDGEDISTPDLLRYISISMKKPLRLFSVPFFLLKIISFILGKHNEMRRLTSSLQVDNTLIRDILKWKPKLNLQEGIKKMVKQK